MRTFMLIAGSFFIGLVFLVSVLISIYSSQAKKHEEAGLLHEQRPMRMVCAKCHDEIRL